MTETVTCPICGDYDGEVSSVKGHITASGGEHEGRTGGQYEELLNARAGKIEADPEDVEPDTDDDSDDTEGNGDQAPDSGGSDDGDVITFGDGSDGTDSNDSDDGDDTMPTPDEYEEQQQRLADDGDGDDSNDPDDGSDTDTDTDGAAGAAAGAGGAALGLVEDVPTLYLVAAAVLIAVVAYLLLADGDGGESTEPADAEPADTASRSGEPTGVIE